MSIRVGCVCLHGRRQQYGNDRYLQRQRFGGAVGWSNSQMTPPTGRAFLRRRLVGRGSQARSSLSGTAIRSKGSRGQHWAIERAEHAQFIEQALQRYSWNDCCQRGRSAAEARLR